MDPGREFHEPGPRVSHTFFCYSGCPICKGWMKSPAFCAATLCGLWIAVRGGAIEEAGFNPLDWVAKKLKGVSKFVGFFVEGFESQCHALLQKD